MNIIYTPIEKNSCLVNERKITPKGLMLHSIGVNQPKATVLVNNYNKTGEVVAVHGFIDGNNGDVYQTLPWDTRANHCGSGAKGSANNTHIAIEMCEPAQIKYTGGANFTFDEKNLSTIQSCVATTYNSAVELFAMLAKKYNLDPLADGVIIGHYEGYARGIASNHGDPEHLWRQSKMPYTMDGFRKDVAKAMGKVESPVETPKEEEKKELYRVRQKWTDAKTQLGAFDVLDNAKALVDMNPDYKVYDSKGKMVYEVKPVESAIPVPFLVKVSTPSLNIRKEPTTDAYVRGQTGVGVFTIVEVQNGSGSEKGWGLLKSYATNRNGWISLDHVTKL